MADYSILVSGLPASGKTTFIAALYHQARSHDINSRLTLREMPEVRDYLTEIEQTWLQFEPMPHTETAALHELTLHLEDESGAQLNVVVPDLSGERFQDLWMTADLANDDLRRQAVAAQGVMIFARADTVRKPHLIEPDQEARVQETDADPLANIHDRVPTQTKITGFLETIDGERGHAPVRMCVIVSAWDTAESLSLTPERWLEFHLPLLWQRLESSAAESPYRVYGVSAQGGDIGDATVKQALAATDPVSLRVRVEFDGVIDSDLTRPLSWIAGLDE
jgi:GTPase SAR1 family protein